MPLALSDLMIWITTTTSRPNPTVIETATPAIVFSFYSFLFLSPRSSLRIFSIRAKAGAPAMTISADRSTPSPVRPIHRKATTTTPISNPQMDSHIGVFFIFFLLCQGKKKRKTNFSSCPPGKRFYLRGSRE